MAKLPLHLGEPVDKPVIITEESQLKPWAGEAREGFLEEMGVSAES